MIVLKNHARAYYNFGRWIADCPIRCGNALALQDSQTGFFCQPPGGCGHIGEVEWPNDPQGIVDAMDGRAPKNKNWFPEDHELALRSGCEHGQTVADLLRETKENLEEGA
jgi:hypothetical protein